MSLNPPFTITSDIVNLVAEISEQVGKKFNPLQPAIDLKLRRINQIKTIQGSLAIEGNTLSEAQITAIVRGKPVIAPAKEIQEVRNAISVYENIEQLNPLSEKDLLQSHNRLMWGLIDEIGRYRSSGVGVMSGNEVIHVAPPAKRVPDLMGDLFHWLKQTPIHPLIASSVFHYEFEFIHPFSDGNGRMGRLWQSLILSQWNAFFLYLPVESMVYQHQQNYYQSIRSSTDASDCSAFIHFMLMMIQNVLHDVTEQTPQDSPQETPQVKRLIAHVTRAHTREELQQILGLNDRKSFQERYLKPAIEAQFIEMTIPDKPNSKYQSYQLTPLGEQIKKQLQLSQKT